MAVLKTAKTTEAYHSFQHLGRCLLRFCWIRLVTSFCGAKCGFTPGRSTTDRIFTLNNIIQSRKEFQKPLWIAFVDFNAWTFDSVDRMALWKLLRSLGLHSKVVNLMEGLYTDTCSCVYVDGVMSDWFAVGSGVRQGCRIAPDLFLGQSYDGTHSTPIYDRCNPGKGGVHWSGLCGWRFFASRNHHIIFIWLESLFSHW